MKAQKRRLKEKDKRKARKAEKKEKKKAGRKEETERKMQNKKNMHPINNTQLKIKRVIEKNFKIIKRTKNSLIVVLGPLLLILLVGLAFSNADKYNITIGVYSQNYGNLTNMLIGRLSEHYITQKEAAEEMCVDNVKRSATNVCVVFPAGLDVYNNETDRDIKFHVDYSEINLIYNIIDILSESVREGSRNISMELTNDILARLQATEAEINSKVPVIVAMAVNNDKIYTAYNEIHDNLAKLDLSINIEEFNSEKVDTEVKHLRNLAYNTLNDADELVEQVENEVKNLSGNKARVRYYLTEGRSNLAEYRDDLKSSSAILDYTVSELKSQMAGTTQKLITANVVRNTAKDRLGETKSVLDDNLDELNKIQESFNEIKKTVTTMSIKDPARIVEPVTTNVMPITNRKTHFNYIFPTLVVLVIMITSILFGSTLILAEKKSKSFFRNFISPTGDSIFLFSTYLTALIVIMLQVILFLAVSSLFFKASILPSLLTTMASLFLASTLFILVGIAVGISFKTEETAILAAITICSVLLFFSNTILPLESMPVFFKTIANFNPFVVAGELLKETIFFNLGLSVLMDKAYILLFYIMLLAFACIFLQNRLRIATLAGSDEAAKKGVGRKYGQSMSMLTLTGIAAGIENKLENIRADSAALKLLSKVADKFEEKMFMAGSAGSSGNKMPSGADGTDLCSTVIHDFDNSLEESLIKDIPDAPKPAEPEKHEQKKYGQSEKQCEKSKQDSGNAPAKQNVVNIVNAAKKMPHLSKPYSLNQGGVSPCPDPNKKEIPSASFKSLIDSIENLKNRLPK